MKKGFINLLEMILVIVSIYISFAVLFPGFHYKSGWDRASLVVEGKDAIITMDRIQTLYENSFSKTSLENFLNFSISTENVLCWSEVGGTIKNKVILDCNCTEEQLSFVRYWFSQLKVNGRYIETVICYTNLDGINPCNDPTDLKHTTDVLLIWGERKDLTLYKNQLQKFLNDGNGVVEIRDFNNEGQVNEVQNEIFGLKWSSKSSTQVVNDQFYRKPDNSADIIYGPHKYFYNFPLPLKTIPNASSSVPIEVGLNPCSDFTEGNFTFNKTAYKFWDCKGESVYFDTDTPPDGNADVDLTTGQNFKIRDYNFTLSYIDGMSKIGIAFRQTYLFEDFLENILGIIPFDGNLNKILIKARLVDSTDAYAVILNSSIGRTAWMAEFSDGEYGDDERHLLMSLLLWASSKSTVSVLSPNLKIGNPISYINVKNADMFEVYRFNLGLGNPYE